MSVTVHEWFLHIFFIIFMSLTLTLTCNQRIDTAKEKASQGKVEKEKKIDGEKKASKENKKTDEKKSSERKRKNSEGKAKAPQVPAPSTPLQQQKAPLLPDKAITLATKVKPVTTVPRLEAVMIADQARVDEPAPEGGGNENIDAGVTTVPITPADAMTLNIAASTLRPRTTMQIEQKDEPKSDIGDGEYEDVNLVEAVAPSMLKETEAETKQGVVAAPLVDLEEKKVVADQSAEKKKPKGTVPAPEPKTSKLKVEPGIVNFSTAGGKLNVVLRNEVGARVAFKVKCSNNHEYGILPIYGFIKVSETASLEITRLPGKPKEDKMVILWEEAKASSTEAKDAFTNPTNVRSITVPLIVTNASPATTNIKAAAPTQPSKPGAAPAPIPAQLSKPAGALALIPAQPSKPAVAPAHVAIQPNKPAAVPPAPIPAKQTAPGVPPPICVKPSPVKPST